MNYFGQSQYLGSAINTESSIYVILLGANDVINSFSKEAIVYGLSRIVKQLKCCSSTIFKRTPQIVLVRAPNFIKKNGPCAALERRRRGVLVPALQEVAAALQEQIDNPVLVQGSTSKQALLSAYLSDPSAVLLGTGAFWEGVDVRGNDLVCVMIDKLPFAAPDDPLLQARLEECRKKGGNPFGSIQIPQAVITLEQGAGRLIRDQADAGVLVICDNRLVTKPYAQTFLGSLPPMKRTRDVSEVEKFLANIEQTEHLTEE